MSAVNPFKRTCQNLIFNIRNFKHPSKRPVFRSSVHPFCTNSQLLDASYTHWLMKTGKTIPSQIFNSLVTLQEEYESQGSKDDNKKFNTLPPSAVYAHEISQTLSIPTQLSIDDQKKKDHPHLHHKIAGFLRQDDFKLILDLIKLHRYELPVNILNEIISKANEKVENLEKDEVIETPRFKGIKELDKVRTHRRIYSDLPHLYEICRIHECRYLNDQYFQENYIWLCYHMNDLTRLQRFLYMYLKNSTYSSKTLSYIMSGFIINYEVEFAKNLFLSLIGILKSLSSRLLEVVIYQFIKVDSIFENINSIFDIWIKSNNCEDPNISTIDLILKENYKFGTNEEVSKIHQYIESKSLNDHYLIQSTKLQNEIIKRDPVNPKKPITQHDLLKIDEICKSINDVKDLTKFYNEILTFLAKHSNIKMIQFIIIKMKKDDIPFNDEFLNILINFYVRSENFLTLINFITSTSTMEQENGLTFNHDFLFKVYKTFVQTYPYHAVNFDEGFQNWVTNNSKLSLESKALILEKCQISKIESRLTPYNLKLPEINTKKYDQSEWSDLKWAIDPLNGRVLQHERQIEFRINKGFQDILRKGIKPDYKMLENTFRRCGKQKRNMIYSLLWTTRLYKHKFDLDVLNLQLSRVSKDDLVRFVNSNNLSVKHKIFLSRIMMNKYLYEETSQLLSSIDQDDMTDKQKMFALNIGLRNHMNNGEFRKMIEQINNFPIDGNILSPFLSHNCRHIERKLVQKSKKDQSSNEDLKQLIDRLHGFIGDVELRLEQDKLDLTSKIKDMFGFFNDWINKSLNETDERRL